MPTWCESLRVRRRDLEDNLSIMVRRYMPPSLLVTDMRPSDYTEAEDVASVLRRSPLAHHCLVDVNEHVRGHDHNVLESTLITKCPSDSFIAYVAIRRTRSVC